MNTNETQSPGSLERLVSGCPCTLTTPCSPQCTCRYPMMSAGCSRCCTYGNAWQQQAAAVRLAEIIDAANAAGELQPPPNNPK